ncbi:gas vesicle protein [Paenibacillus sp. FSL R7-269]|nr:gas vesicle protein [Paenibacillus sp. FSL R7-269]
MKKDSKSLLWGVLAGSIVGSVTALLFAPKPGKELRKDIAEGTTEAVDKVQVIAGQASEKTTEIYGKAKEAVVSVAHEVKEWSKSAKCAVEEADVATVSGIAEQAVEVTDAVEAVKDEIAAYEAAEQAAVADAEIEAVTGTDTAVAEAIEDGKTAGKLS